MSKEKYESSSEESKSDSETNDKSQALVNYSKKSIKYLYCVKIINMICLK